MVRGNALFDDASRILETLVHFDTRVAHVNGLEFNEILRIVATMSEFVEERRDYPSNLPFGLTTNCALRVLLQELFHSSVCDLRPFESNLS